MPSLLNEACHDIFPMYFERIIVPDKVATNQQFLHLGQILQFNNYRKL